MVSPFCPERGDIVWLVFDPQMGSEQAGTRPAITLSPKMYNMKTGLAVFCPITSQIKGYPFEVEISAGLKISGVILSDQIKSLDWRKRQSAYICKAPRETLSGVLAKVKTLIA